MLSRPWHPVGFAPQPEIVDPGGGFAPRNEICTGPELDVGTTAAGGVADVEESHPAARPAPASAAPRQRRLTMSRLLERTGTQSIIFHNSRLDGAEAQDGENPAALDVPGAGATMRECGAR